MSSNSISNKKKKLVKTVTIKLGCMSSCARPKLSSIFSPKPKAAKYEQTHFNQHYYNYQTTPTTTSATFSSDQDCCYYNNYQTTPTTTTNTTSSSSPFVDEFGKAVAVEKDSSEPYLDFRASMLQMIVENEMYTKDDLRHLLTCFLQLNSPCLHAVIIRAFTEIWNSFFFSSASSSSAAPTSSSAAAAAQGRHSNFSARRGGRKDFYGRPPKAYVRPKSYEI